MSTVLEIECAIERLPARVLTKLAQWMLQRDHEGWDRQMDQDADAAAAKLDFLIQEADAARTKLHAQGGTRPRLLR